MTTGAPLQRHLDCCTARTTRHPPRGVLPASTHFLDSAVHHLGMNVVFAIVFSFFFSNLDRRFGIERDSTGSPRLNVSLPHVGEFLDACRISSYYKKVFIQVLGFEIQVVDGGLR